MFAPSCKKLESQAEALLGGLNCFLKIFEHQKCVRDCSGKEKLGKIHIRNVYTRSLKRWYQVSNGLE